MKVDLSLHRSCLTDDHCAIIVSKDKGSPCQHRALNRDKKSRVRQFRIDGDVIPAASTDIRCDFLVTNDDKPTAYYVELKGSDILHAIDQILATEQYCKDSLPGYSSYYRVIYRTATLELRGAAVLAWKRRLKGRLLITNQCCEEAI